jgi:iron complex transport system substrate-binding protein
VRRASFALCALLAACGRGRPVQSHFALQDDWGRRVALAAPAQRIVSLAPATTELVFALGLGARLVGRTTWCDWPSEAASVPDVGNGIGPNVEAIAGRRPDLVLVYPSEANRAAIRQLEGLGIAVAVVRQNSIADWRQTARWVAEAAGVPARGDSLVADTDRRLAEATAPPGRAARRMLIAAGTNPPIVIGAGSFLSELVARAGGRNAFDDIAAASAEVSLEAIVARDPDVVLVLGGDAVAAQVAQRPGWRAIRAVREGRIVAVEGSAFDRPSPRLPQAVRTLAARLAALEAAR